MDPLAADPGLGDLYLVDLFGVDGEDVPVEDDKASLVTCFDQSGPVERRDLPCPSSPRPGEDLTVDLRLVAHRFPVAVVPRPRGGSDQLTVPPRACNRSERRITILDIDATTTDQHWVRIRCRTVPRLFRELHHGRECFR